MAAADRLGAAAAVALDAELSDVAKQAGSADWDGDAQDDEDDGDVAEERDE